MHIILSTFTSKCIFFPFTSENNQPCLERPKKMSNMAPTEAEVTAGGTYSLSQPPGGMAYISGRVGG
jgi:hypothetical protein